MTTRPPVVGDFVLADAWLVRAGVYRGTIGRVVRATAATAWLDNDTTIKADRSSYVKDDPWRRITYVPAAEVKRWMAARAAMVAWKKAIPAGARWCRPWESEEAYVVVDFNDRVDTAEEADRRAAVYAAFAEWLRAKPDEDSLLIRIGAAP